MQKSTTILGIETSCDETAASVVRRHSDGRGEILSNLVLSQVKDHAPYGGVVPEVAARAHIHHLDRLVKMAVAEANLTFSDLDAVSATAGPGLSGGLIVGLTMAKGIALAKGLPFLAINHLEGHALTPRLLGDVEFPYLLLLISGGHTQFQLVRGVGDYQRLGTTIDDALGEAFDKTAKLLGLGYPGGPLVETYALRGNATRFDLPRPLKGRAGCDFSFSGLKTAVRETAEDLGVLTDQDKADLCASFQKAVTETIADRLRKAFAMFKAEAPSALRAPPPAKLREEVQTRSLNLLGELSEGLRGTQPAKLREDVKARSLNLLGELSEGLRGPNPTLVVAGGVAANKAIREMLETTAIENGFELSVPPFHLCTDNAAMIAWAAAERFALGLSDDMAAPVRPRWPLDTVSAPAYGSGRLGAKA
jgi:N6-L-threonylcarbamoyladenine synthase